MNSVSWKKWKPNSATLTSLVSQGLEQVTKFKDDVEKQFDEAVGGNCVSQNSPSDPLVATAANGPIDESIHLAQTNASLVEAHALISVLPDAVSSDEHKGISQLAQNEAIHAVNAKNVVVLGEEQEVATDHNSLRSGDVPLAFNQECKTTPEKCSPLASHALEITEEEDHVDHHMHQLQSALQTISRLSSELQKVQTDNDFLRNRMEREEFPVSTSSSSSLTSSFLPSSKEALLLQTMQEKDNRIKGLLEEGEALSKKQSQYEQRLRALRKEKDESCKQADESAADLARATEVNGQLMSELKDVKSVRKELERDLKKFQHELDKAEKEKDRVEGEMRSLNKRFHSLQLEADNLRSEKKEWQNQQTNLQKFQVTQEEVTENRIILEQTVEQLQINLKRQSDEFQHREMDLLDQLKVMKGRWQSTVERMNEMGQNVSEATHPLLRQITALQMDAQSKSQVWTSLEKALQARLASMEKERDLLTQQVEHFKDQLFQASEQCKDLQTLHTSLQKELERTQQKIAWLEKRETQHLETMDAFQIRIQAIENEKNDLLRSHRGMEVALSSTKARLGESAQEQFSKQEILKDQLLECKRENETLRGELEDWKHKCKILQNQHRKLSAAPQSLPEVLLVPNNEENNRVSVNTASLTPSVAPLACNEQNNLPRFEQYRLQQSLRQKENECVALHAQMRQLEEEKQHAMQQIIDLTTKNAMYYEDIQSVGQCREDLRGMTQRHDVLLEMLGEKTEQLEDLQVEFAQFKALYQSQIDVLTKERK